MGWNCGFQQTALFLGWDFSWKIRGWASISVYTHILPPTCRLYRGLCGSLSTLKIVARSLLFSFFFHFFLNSWKIPHIHKSAYIRTSSSNQYMGNCGFLGWELLSPSVIPSSVDYFKVNLGHDSTLSINSLVCISKRGTFPLHIYTIPLKHKGNKQYLLNHVISRKCSDFIDCSTNTWIRIQIRFTGSIWQTTSFISFYPLPHFSFFFF